MNSIISGICGWLDDWYNSHLSFITLIIHYSSFIMISWLHILHLFLTASSPHLSIYKESIFAIQILYISLNLYDYLSNYSITFHINWLPPSSPSPSPYSPSSSLGRFHQSSRSSCYSQCRQYWSSGMCWYRRCLVLARARRLLWNWYSHRRRVLLSSIELPTWSLCAWASNQCVFSG